MFRRITVLFIFTFGAQHGFAQGEDSLPSERDLLVIEQMLPGLYVNGNQTYFERRGGVDESLRHQSLELRIESTTSGFTVVSTSGEQSKRYTGVLVSDTDEARVRMTLTLDDDKPASCDYVWSREAMQFRAVRLKRCDARLPEEVVLSEKEFWVQTGKRSSLASDTPYRLHRAREFSCYADIPGVGGGRDLPYERYDGFKIHDQGGAVWFDTKETPSRRMGISLFLVDWPINNYKGVFTRDSLVVYVSEDIDGEIKEHGYAFTIPDADRVGVNLKWMLASCFMFSNADETPFM